ncbi:MAG: class I SAM-dependent methyltransferase [Endomicrobiales bacterium]
MKQVNWDELSRKGLLQGVLDPNDGDGTKNLLIDRIHWQALAPRLGRPGRLLDFGCGTGRYAARLAARGFSYAGVDTSAGMIEEARRHNPRLAPLFSVIAGGASLPFPDAAFDYCLTTGVMQFLIRSPGIGPLFGEFRRVLRPGGAVLIVEQVSRSGKSSGLTSHSATEEDYTAALAPGFEIKDLQRIRGCSFGRAASWTMSHAVVLGFLAKKAVPALARLERRRMQRAPEACLRSLDYYDILVEARRR